MEKVLIYCLTTADVMMESFKINFGQKYRSEHNSFVFMPQKHENCVSCQKNPRF